MKCASRAALQFVGPAIEESSTVTNGTTRIESCAAAFQRAVEEEKRLRSLSKARPGEPGHDPALWAQLQEAEQACTRAYEALREALRLISPSR